MAYTNTWGAGYEAVPADTDNVSGGASEIRKVKSDVRERLASEHVFGLGDGDNQGIHKFPVGATAGRPTGMSGRLFLNSDYNTLDYYDGAAWNVVGIPKNTRMVFHQTAAPTGWTKDTTANLNDTALRVVTGAIGSQIAAQAFSTAFAAGRATPSGGSGTSGGTVVTVNNTNLALSVNNTNLGLSVAGHALTQAEMPTHYHLLVRGPTSSAIALTSTNYIAETGVFGTNSKYVLAADGSAPNLARSGNAGSGSSHTHTLNGTTGSHSHTLSGSTGNHTHTTASHTHSTPNHTHTLDMNVNYHDVVICTKN